MRGFDVISISGYGNSGASAVIDLLKADKDLQVDDKHEWQQLHQCDGIFDLKYYLVNNRDKISSNTAIKRFWNSLFDNRCIQIDRRYRKEYRKISSAYLHELIQCEWDGYSALDGREIQGIEKTWEGRVILGGLRYLSRKLGYDLALPRSKKRYFSMLSEKEFDRITVKYLQRILKLSGFSENKPVVLEQLFIYSDPLCGNHYFKSSKTILIDRDPRDVYASVKFSAKDGEPMRICRFFPSDNAESFIKYFKALHRNVTINDSVYLLRFEDLIYDTANTIEKLNLFLHTTIDVNKSGFNPQKSRNNTQFYKRFPEIGSDIRMIEEALPEYLYPFS